MFAVCIVQHVLFAVCVIAQLTLCCCVHLVIGSKKYCRLHFICMGRGDHCLYDHTFFTTKTKHSRIWIHVMFLAVQVRGRSVDLLQRIILVMRVKKFLEILFLPQN